MKKVNIQDKLNQFQDYWNPKIVGELNDQQVKLAKLKGEFVWHKHNNEDELFYVVHGHLRIELRDKTLDLYPGEFCIIPRGVEHKPVANDEVSIMLFEPASTINTGNVIGEKTKEKIEYL